MSEIFDVAVIGNGMIGAAASRYLSAAGLQVAAVGPSEPANWKTHEGAFASHYDEGRITRIIDPNGIWGLLAKRSIAAYAGLEAQSGIAFHGAAGCLRVSPDIEAEDDTLLRAESVGRKHDAVFTHERVGEGLEEIFSFLAFPMGATALWERGGAGYVNPRQLVRAQLTAAAQQGATMVNAAVTGLTKGAGEVLLTTSSGATVRTHRVLIAAGAYSGWLLPRPLDLRRKAVTVLLAELGPAEAQRLRAMPSIIYRLLDNPILQSIYSLPPLPYPDGKIYLKIGGTLREPVYAHSAAALQEWFHGDGNPVERDALQAVLWAMVPGLQAAAVHSRPCVVTYTAHDYPYVDQVEEQIFVAAGGCGAAAKSSDEIGRMAALLVENQGAWRYDLPASLFSAVYQ